MNAHSLTEIERASTVPPPALKRYVEAKVDYLFDAPDGGTISGIISGHVELPDGIVTAFSAEDDDGNPLRLTDEFMPAALEHLVDKAAGISRCGCGRTFDAAAWATLPIVGDMPGGAGGVLELRNCPCGSTIACEKTPS